MVGQRSLYFWVSGIDDVLEVLGEDHQYLVFKGKYSPGIRAMLFIIPLIVSSEWGCRSSDSFSLLNVLSTLLSIWNTKRNELQILPLGKIQIESREYLF